MPDSFVHDPDEVSDFERDWSADLGADTITTSTWTVDDGLTVDDEDNDTTTASIRISGGTLWTTYEATNHIVTAAGNEYDKTLRFIVRPK